MADDPKKDDLEFLKEFSDVPPPPVIKRSRLGMSIQFFIVPSVIVGICIALFLVFRFMTEETQTLPDLLQRMMVTTGHEKQVYMDSFVRKLHQVRGDRNAPPSPELTALVPEILASIKSLSGRELDLAELEVKALCMRSLAVIGDPSVADEMQEIIDAEKKELVQWEGIETLGALKNPESVPFLRKYLHHESPKTRKYAAFNLGALRSPEAIPDLKASLTDESIEVRWNSAFALAYFLKDRSGVPVLLQMLDRAAVDKAVDSKEAHRDLFINHCMALAAQALAVIEEPSAVPVLEKVAENDPSSEVRSACRSALKVIQKK